MAHAYGDIAASHRQRARDVRDQDLIRWICQRVNGEAEYEEWPELTSNQLELIFDVVQNPEDYEGLLNIVTRHSKKDRFR